jgi:iron complex outermembrane receptor protein
VRGRVLNTATGEYVRNAEIRVEGTTIVAFSEDGGDFRLTGVPSGDVTVVVKYTGLQEAKAVVTVAPGQVATLDVALSPLSYAAQDGEVEAVTIVARREGQASAIMERRASTNAKTVVAADNFGALTMGDVGEFMKNMPGLSLDYTEVDATAVRIGGLDPKYSTFTTDGARMATATSNNNNGRQNSFEQMSITGIDSIELNNTLQASMDADSPGGAINLRSKYAFQRNGRLLRFQLGGVATSDSSLSRKYLPDDKKHASIFPSAQIGYADVFLDGRLGIAFNASYNANFVEQDRIQTDWSYLANGRVIPYQVMWRPGPKLTHRKAANLSVDYKLTDQLALSLRSTYSFYDVEYFNQYTYLIFGTTTATQATADSTPTHIVVNPNGTNTRLHTQYSHRYAGTPSWLFAPKLEYRGDTWEALLRASYSSSEFNFRDNDKGFFQRTDSYLTRIGFTLDRASQDSNAWTLQQTAGRSWSDPTSFNRDDDIGNNIRTSESDAHNQMYGLNLDLKKKLALGPVQLKVLAGATYRTNVWKTNEGSYQQFQYIGPTHDLTQKAPEAVIPWTQNYNFQIHGFDAGNLNAQNWRADSNYAVYDIYKEHPDYFVARPRGQPEAPARQQQEGRRDGQRRLFRSPAARRQGPVRPWPALRKHQDRRPDRRRPSGQGGEGRRPVDPSHRRRPALSVPQRDLHHPPRRVRRLVPERRGQVRLHQEAGRPAGLQPVDPAPRLRQPRRRGLGGRHQPDRHGAEPAAEARALDQVLRQPAVLPGAVRDHRPVRLPAGGEGHAGDRATSSMIRRMSATAPATIPATPIRSATNLPGVSINRGLTLEYDQQLTFLPGALRGLGLRGSITKIDPDGERVNMPKTAANWGLRYSYGKFDVQLTGNAQSKYRTSALSNTPTTANNGVLYHAARELWNVSASYKINKQLRSDAGRPQHLQRAGRHLFQRPRPGAAVQHLRLDVERRDQGHLLGAEHPSAGSRCRGTPLARVQESDARSPSQIPARGDPSWS